MVGCDKKFGRLKAIGAYSHDIDIYFIKFLVFKTIYYIVSERPPYRAWDSSLIVIAPLAC